MAEETSRQFSPDTMNDLSIFTAKYSSLDVFETKINNVAVMKLKKKQQVNAGQILKLAKLPKKKRTQIIKKLAQTIDGERIDFGFFKFQGFWIPLDAAKRLAKKWNVEKQLSNLFECDESWIVGEPPKEGETGINEPTIE